MKKNLSILDFEDKKTQTGSRYTRFKTSDGWLSCFDTKTCEMLKNLESASVEIKESGEFKNIAKCYGSADGDVPVVKPGEPVKSKSTNGQTAMYVSYAKDIFIAMVDKEKNIPDQMKDAVELVKQAKEAFD